MPISLESLQVDVDADTSKAERGLDKFYRDANGKLRRANGQFASDADKARLAGTKLGDQLGVTGKKAEEAGRRTKRGSGLLAGAAATIRHAAGPALVAGVGAAIMSAKDFDLTIRQVGVQTGQTGQGLDDLRQMAMQMGKDTAYSAKDAGQAMLELAKGGLTAADIKAGALKTTMTLAAAGGLDMASSAGYVTQAMNTFGIGADKANQVAVALAGGANASTASVETLGMALSQVGPGATTAGMSLQETVAALAAFDNAGIKGSDAGTSLKTMLSSLVPATDEARAAMAKYGLEFTNADGSFKSMSQVAQELQDGLGGLSEAQRTATLRTIFGSDATRAATVLMKEGSKGIDGYIKATKNQATVQKMAGAAMGGAAGAWEEFKGSVETLAIQIGTALLPAFIMAARGGATFIDFISSMLSAMGRAIGVVRGFLAEHKTLANVLKVAGVAAAGFAAGFLAVMAVQKVIAVIKAIRLAMLALNAAMLANPIGLIVGAIAALVAAFVYAYTHFEGFRRVVDTVVAALRTGLGAALDWVRAKWAAWGPSIIAGLNTVRAGFMGFLAWILPVWRASWSAVAGVLSAVWGTIKGVVSGALQVVRGIINVVLGVIRGDWSRVWKGLGQIVSGAWGIIKSLIKGGIATAKAVVTGGLGMIRAAFSAAWSAVKAVTSAAWSAVTRAVSAGVTRAVGFVRGLPGKASAALGNLGGYLAGKGRALIDGLISGITDKIGDVGAAMGKIAGKIKGFLPGSPVKEGPLRSWNNGGAGKRLMKTLSKGILSGRTTVAQAMRKVTDALEKEYPGAKNAKRRAKMTRAIRTQMEQLGARRRVGMQLAGKARKSVTGGQKGAEAFVSEAAKGLRANLSGRDEKRAIANLVKYRTAMRKAYARQAQLDQQLKAAVARRDQLVEAKANLQQAMAGGISAQANVLNAGNNASTIRASLDAQVAKAKTFVANLQKMRAMGYSQAIIEQVASAGIEQGAEVAAALTQASRADMQGINASFGQINSIAKSASAQLASQFYDSGIQAANGLIAGLQRQQKAVEAQLVRIAVGMEKAIKRALGIRSPSRVMAALGRFAGKGLALGVAGQRKAVAKSASLLASTVSASAAGGFDYVINPGGPRRPGDPGSGGAPFTPASTSGGASGGGDVHFHFTTNNPVAEPESRTTNKALDKAATLGLV